MHPCCKNTIAELQQWSWKQDDRSGDYLDQPLEINDDAMAALRYGIEGMRKAQKLSTVEGLEI